MRESIKEIAEKLKGSSREALPELIMIRDNPMADRDFIEEHLKNYYVIRLMMMPEEISDNLTQMVRISTARSLNMAVEELKEKDMPGACGSAPAVLSKRILLFLAIQKELGIKIPPDETPDIQTVQDLTDILLPLLHEQRK